MTKRRAFTPEFKTHVVLELLSGVKSQAELCREHGAKTRMRLPLRQQRTLH